MEWFYNGAEPIKPETIEQLKIELAKHGMRSTAFYPCYGLAESTLFVTGNTFKSKEILKISHRALLEGEITESTEKEDEYHVVSCGTPQAGSKVIIMPEGTNTIHYENTPLGEILVDSPSNCKGYISENDVLDTSLFHNVLFDGKCTDYLKTGDLGFIKNGLLYIVGRIKDVIILNGKNYHAHDFENILESQIHAIKDGTAMAFQDDKNRLIVAFETVKPLESSVMVGLKEEVHSLIYSNFMSNIHDIYITPRRTTPKTTSGKKQRNKLKNLYLKSKQGVTTMPAVNQVITPVEKDLSSYIQKIIPMIRSSLENDDVNILESSRFSSLHADSVTILEISDLIKQEYNVSVSMDFMSQDPTVQDLAKYVHEHE